MRKKIGFGVNRTGIGTAPFMSREMIEGALTLTMAPEGDGEKIALERTRLTKRAEPVGSVPLPTAVMGAFDMATQAIQGGNGKMLIDKLGERLGFERAGVRLYEALISKRLAESLADDEFPLSTLVNVRDEELSHFSLVKHAIQSIGADPTVITPCADIVGVASMGLLQVANDPKIAFLDALQALLVAELTDNAGWELLIPLAREAGMGEFTAEFESALQAEKRHLNIIRGWIEKLVLQSEEERRRVA